MCAVIDGGQNSGVGVILASTRAILSSVMGTSILGQFNRIGSFNLLGCRRITRGVTSTSVIIYGGALLSSRAVQFTGGLGCVKLFTANCGGVSLSCYAGGNVAIYGTNSCSAGTITRRAFTLVLRRFGRATRCGQFIRSKE